jgi:hypothetical protein
MIILATDRNKPGRRFQDSTIFLSFFFCQISYSKFWIDGTFQATAHTIYDIRLHQIHLNLQPRFCFNNLIIQPIYYCALVQTINKLHEDEFL